MLASNVDPALATSELSEQLLHSPRTLTDERRRSSIDPSSEECEELKAAAPQSTNSPISSLPVELLSHIFILADDNSTITQVCQHWQVVAIDTAELWTRITYDDYHSSRVQLDEKLERSKALPQCVTIYLRFPQQGLPEGPLKPDYLLRHLDRIESLVVDLSTWSSFKGWGLEYIAMNKRCRKRAPKLRYLVLRWSDRFKRVSAKSVSRMFPGANLYHLDLRRAGIAWDSHLLSHRLTYLHLSDFPRDEMFARQEIREVLGRMPGLEDLCLKNVLQQIGDLPKLSTVHLPYLKVLILKDGVQSLADFFMLVTFPGTLDVLQVRALGSARTQLAFINTMAVRVQEACNNWGGFWSPELQSMVITARMVSSMSRARATFRGFTGSGVEKLLIELPWARQTPAVVEHTSSALFRSGAHGIRSVVWSCPGEACLESMYGAFRGCAKLEQVTVGRCGQLSSLARCLEDPTFYESIQNLGNIVIEGLRIAKKGEGNRVQDAWEKELGRLTNVLAWRKENKRQVQKVTLCKCVIPECTYQRLVDIVGEVERID